MGSFSPPASGGLREAANARNPKSRSEFPPGGFRWALPEGALAARITGSGGGGSGGTVMDLEETVRQRAPGGPDRGLEWRGRPKGSGWRTPAGRGGRGARLPGGDGAGWRAASARSLGKKVGVRGWVRLWVKGRVGY